MNALRFETTIDEAVATAVPPLRPLIGKRVEIVAYDAKPAPAPRPHHALDDFLRHRLKRPTVPPVTLEDMERAIAIGALRGNV